MEGRRRTPDLSDLRSSPDALFLELLGHDKESQRIIFYTLIK